jgi:hypothetical protein
MGSVIGDILPTALGVAISPVPIIAVILMLLAPHAKAASVAFLVGWVAGIAVLVTVVALLVDPSGDSSVDSPSTFSSILKLVLGSAAVLLGLMQWERRPQPGQEAEMPAWMSAVDTITATKALGLGALLSAVNPKNLTLCLAGGVSIGAGGLSGPQTAVAITVFVVIASLSIGVPVIGYLMAESRMREPLEELRGWLTEHNAAVMTVLLVVIGVAIFGKGLAGF